MGAGKEQKVGSGSLSGAASSAGDAPLSTQDLFPGAPWGPGARRGGGEGPIDAIFAFHQALRKELDYLCNESRRLGECCEDRLRDFSGRFHFLWGLYR